MSCLFDIWKAEAPVMPHTSRFWPAFDEASVQAFLASGSGEPVPSRGVDRAALDEYTARFERFIAKIEKLDEAEYPCKPEYLALEREHLTVLAAIRAAADGRMGEAENTALYGSLADLRVPDVMAFLKLQCMQGEAHDETLRQARELLSAAWPDVEARDPFGEFFKALDGYRKQLRPYTAGSFGFVPQLLASYAAETFTSEQIVEILQTALREVFGEDRAGWNAEIREQAPNVFIAYDTQAIVVPAGRTFTMPHAEKLIIHEMGVHVVRAVNGLRSQERLSGFGMANYNVAEEAIGVLAQLASQDGLDPLAAFGAALVKVAVVDFGGRVSTFREVYDLTRALLICMRPPADAAALHALERQAFSITARAYRMGTGVPVDRAVTKYWYGMILLNDYFSAHPLTSDMATDLLLGKYDIQSARQKQLIISHVA